MAVDVRSHQLAGVVGTDDLHREVIVLDLREQGGHLQEFQGVVAEGDGNVGIDHAHMIVDGIRRAFGQILLVGRQILGRRPFLPEIVRQDGDVIQVGGQFRPHQFQGRPHGALVPLPVQNALHREGDHDTQGDGQHPAEKCKEPFFERCHHIVEDLDKDNVFRGKRLHLPLEIQPGAAQGEIQPDIQVQFHLVAGQDGIRPVLDRQIVDQRSDIHEMEGDVIAPEQQIDAGRVQVERKTDAFTHSVQRGARGHAQETGRIPVQGESPRMTGENGASPALIEQADTQPLVEGHPEFRAEMDPERKHLEGGAGTGPVLETENAGKGLGGFVEFPLPGVLLPFFLSGGLPGIGRIRRYALDFPIPAHGAQIQDGGRQGQHGQDVPARPQIQGGAVAGRSVMPVVKINGFDVQFIPVACVCEGRRGRMQDASRLDFPTVAGHRQRHVIHQDFRFLDTDEAFDPETDVEYIVVVLGPTESRFDEALGAETGSREIEGSPALRPVLPETEQVVRGRNRIQAADVEIQGEEPPVRPKTDGEQIHARVQVHPVVLSDLAQEVGRTHAVVHEGIQVPVATRIEQGADSKIAPGFQAGLSQSNGEDTPLALEGGIQAEGIGIAPQEIAGLQLLGPDRKRRDGQQDQGRQNG